MEFATTRTTRERNENMSATSIGLPKLKIAFEKAAQATANRAKKGYVGMIVRDAKAQGQIGRAHV